MMMMNKYFSPVPKESKRIKITGKKKEALHRYIHERDDGKCLICSQPVQLGYSPHHIEYKSGQGDDTADNRATICITCDDLLHHGDPDILLKKIISNFKAKHIIQFFLLGLVKVIESRSS